MSASDFFTLLLQTLKFPYKDTDWLKKAVIGSGLVLSQFFIPIIPLLMVYGYAKRIMYRIIVENGEPYLPEWDDWGNLLSDGFKLWGAGYLFSLPIILLLLVAFAALLFSIISLFLFPHNDGSITPGYFLMPISIFICAIGIFTFLQVLSILTAFVEAPALSHLVAKNRFSAAFSIKEWWPILRYGFIEFAMVTFSVLFFSLVGSMAISFLTMSIILIVIFPVLLGVYAFLLPLYTFVYYSLAYREGVRKLPRTNQQV